ncbi:MAG: hypothetical protein EZS28_014216 [Streblomastix strix]|uniref:Uncharacterized protein n=1 Tax=Streblomastix strix TaxID=222440 RepID=A0A5J4W5X9_9EUKA|nr:MAG: hypothetical protein EZS28_014216 [Streblomastix strix]
MVRKFTIFQRTLLLRPGYAQIFISLVFIVIILTFIVTLPFLLFQLFLLGSSAIEQHNIIYGETAIVQLHDSIGKSQLVNNNCAVFHGDAFPDEYSLNIYSWSFESSIMEKSNNMSVEIFLLQQKNVRWIISPSDGCECTVYYSV